MKKSILFVVMSLLVLSIGFASCNNNKGKLVVGKWKVVSLSVNEEDWPAGRETMGDVPNDAPQFNAICTFREDGTCTVFLHNSLFMDGKYLIDDGELKIINLSPDEEWEDLEEENYDIRLNIERITKETLMGNGIFEIRDRNTMKIKDGYAINITLKKV